MFPSDKRRIIWCFSAPHQKTREQHSSKSVPAAIFSRTKGEKMCTLVLSNSPVSLFCCLLVHTMISGHTGFIWAALTWLCLTVCDMCHVSCWHWDGGKGYGDWLVRTRSLRSSRNPCWWLWSWHHVSPQGFRATTVHTTALNITASQKKNTQSCLIQSFSCYILISFCSLFF